MELEIIERDIKVPRLTLTPTRTTIKYPLNFNDSTKQKIEALIKEKIIQIKATKSWRGKFNKSGITLFNDSKTERLTFKFIEKLSEDDKSS